MREHVPSRSSQRVNDVGLEITQIEAASLEGLELLLHIFLLQND